MLVCYIFRILAFLMITKKPDDHPAASRLGYDKRALKFCFAISQFVNLQDHGRPK